GRMREVPHVPRRTLVGLLRGGRRALFVRQVDDAVLRVDVHDLRPVSGVLRFVHHAVGGDDDEVAPVHEVRGGPVDADFSAPTLPGDHVGRDPRAVRHVVDVDLLVLEEARRLDEVDVDGDGPDVVQVGAGDGGSMDFAQQKGSQHVFLRSGPYGPRHAWTLEPPDAAVNGDVGKPASFAV